MAFVVTMDEDFDGVIYTRGSFHRKDSNCFLDAKGGVDFALKIPYDDCGSKHVGKPIKVESVINIYTT